MHEFVKTANALDDLHYAAGNLLTAIEDGTYHEATAGMDLSTRGWLEAHDPQLANAIGRVTDAYRNLHA